MLKTVRIRQEGQLSLSYSDNWRYWETLMENTSQFPHLPFVCPIKQAVCVRLLTKVKVRVLSSDKTILFNSTPT